MDQSPAFEMPARLRVLITDRAWPDFELERELLAPVGAEIVEATHTDEGTLAALARDCDAIGTCWANVTQAVIRAATRCRIIARFGIGLDNICVKTATELGIPVTYLPDYCVDEVAEHTLALLLAVARRVPLFDERTKRGEYDRSTDPPIRRLSGRTLGLVGFGRIAQAVFHRAVGLGLKVMAHSPSGYDRGTGCRMVSLEEVLAESDFVSLHCPLTDGTRGLIGSQQFALMKPTAYLINTARGALVSEEALWEVIQTGRIAGAALDVFDPEPPDLTGPLFRDERVLVTPHAAFLSADSLYALRSRTAKQIADALQLRRPEHLVNPDVWRGAAARGPSPE